jgi:hypothetical protein
VLVRYRGAVLSFRRHGGLLNANQRRSTNAMRRLVALVGSTTNKFEQTLSVRVRDFATGCTPRSSILTTLKHLMTSVVFLHMASLRLSQPAMTSRRSGRGRGSRVPCGRPCCRSRRSVTLSRLRGFHSITFRTERETRFGLKSAPHDRPQEPRMAAV